MVTKLLPVIIPESFFNELTVNARAEILALTNKETITSSFYIIDYKLNLVLNEDYTNLSNLNIILKSQ